jgi:hypothetical protein
VDENGDGLDVQRVVQVGSGGTSGTVTDGLETFGSDNLKSEVAGDSKDVLLIGSVITCVAADSTPEKLCLSLLFLFGCFKITCD